MVEYETLSTLIENLFKTFPEAKITRMEKEMSLPEETFNPARKQYDSTRILSHISSTIEKNIDKILGVTSMDLYVPELNFVFGEAQCPGRVAIISIHRLRPEFYGYPKDQVLLIERATKEAVHELGHTSGLLHCENLRCVMSFSNSILDIDQKDSTFCPECNISLTQNKKNKP